jgi:hypothetical protein
MERRIFGQNSFIGVYIHCIIIIHLFMWHSLDIHHFELNSYFHVPILNIKVHHHDATRCTMVELRTYRGHRGILHGDWGQVHHSLLNCIYEGHKGCPHLLHCELRTNTMALYFVTALSRRFHIPPPPPSAFLMWNGQMIIHKNLAYQWYPALKIEFLDIPTYLSSLNLLHLRDDEGCGLACWKEMRGRNIEIELAS